MRGVSISDNSMLSLKVTCADTSIPYLNPGTVVKRSDKLAYGSRQNEQVAGRHLLTPRKSKNAMNTDTVFYTLITNSHDNKVPLSEMCTP